MKRLFLIHGNPKSGKSTLAEELRDKHSFNVLSLDELYVEFIKTKCQEFYFERLRNYIRQHYHCILDSGGYTKLKFGRDFLQEWHDYLFATTSGLSARHDSLAVEGYLLGDCLSDLVARLSAGAQVFVIHVSNGVYFFRDAPLATNDIASLGQRGEHSPQNPSRT